MRATGRFVLLLLSLGISARAEDVAGAKPETTEPPRNVGYEPREKIIWGSRGYFSSDSSVYVDKLPNGFNLTPAYSFYSSDVSSRTSTISLDAGIDLDGGSGRASLAITPVSNDYRAYSLGVGGTLRTSSREYRTTFGLDLDVTQHTQTIHVSKTVTRDANLRETTPTFSFSQRFHATKLTLAYGKSSYDQDVQKLSDKIKPNNIRLAGLGGLLQGFPDTVFKVGLYQDLEGAPVTLWINYIHTTLLVPTQSAEGTSDSQLLGVDWDATKAVTLTFQYNHFTQTGQPAANYLGLAASVRLEGPSS